MMAKQRGNSQKPSSAPAKNRIRSQSPMNIEGQTQNQTNASTAPSGNQGYQQTGNSKQKGLIANNFVGG